VARRRAGRDDVPADRAQRARARQGAGRHPVAGIAACTVGEREFVKLAERYGIAHFDRLCRELLDYTERFTRAEIAKLPNGSWRFVDHLDGDGIDPGPIRIVATVTIRDEMTIDLTGSAPQVRGAINCVFPFTLSTALACVRSIVDLSIPNNAGYFRPIA
jgi:N-methylhydantoinase B